MLKHSFTQYALANTNDESEEKKKYFVFKFKIKRIYFKVAYPTPLFFGVISSHCWVEQ